jgi:DNA-binding LacI/PurR family transcriptional regulator
MSDQDEARRASVQASQIAEDLRGDIVAGRLDAGQRIPTRVQIEKRFQASPVTVQRALDTLTEEGFVVSRGRQGTFVAERPPHRHRWALVFPLNPHVNGWNRYFAGLLRESQKSLLATETLTPVFLVREGNQHYARDVARLVADLTCGRLAGCIYTLPMFMKNEALQSSPRPSVTLCGAIDSVQPAVVNGGDWVELALSLLQTAGRRRLAYIGSVPTARQLERHAEHIASHGMTLHRHWSIGINPDAQAVPLARDIVRLLLDRPGAERPDGLMVGDDNLLEAALQGIKELGLSTPRDLTVIAHANHPEPDQPAMPCIRLGLDLRQMLRAGLGLAMAVRDGGKPKPVVLQPVTEPELR